MIYNFVKTFVLFIKKWRSVYSNLYNKVMCLMTISCKLIEMIPTWIHSSDHNLANFKCERSTLPHTLFNCNHDVSEVLLQKVFDNVIEADRDRHKNCHLINAQCSFSTVELSWVLPNTWQIFLMFWNQNPPLPQPQIHQKYNRNN